MNELNRVSASGSASTLIPLAHPLQKKGSEGRSTSGQVFADGSLAATHLAHFNPSTETAPRAGLGILLGSLPPVALQKVVNHAVYEGGSETGGRLRKTSSGLRSLLPATPAAQLVQWARQIAQPSDAMLILGARVANPLGNPSGLLTIRNLPPEQRLEPLKALAITLGEGWPLMERVRERMALEVALQAVPQEMLQNLDQTTAQAINSMAHEKTQELVNTFSPAAQVAIASGNISRGTMEPEHFNAYMAYKDTHECHAVSVAYTRALNTQSDPDDWACVQRNFLASSIHTKLLPNGANAHLAMLIAQAAQQWGLAAQLPAAPVIPPEELDDIAQFSNINTGAIRERLDQYPNEQISQWMSKYHRPQIQLEHNIGFINAREHEMRSIYCLPHGALRPSE
jgi:hypothetical protein